jgi:hypothetical protein
MMRKTAATMALLGLVLSSAALPCFAIALAPEPERAAPMADCEDPGQANHAVLCAEPGFAAPLAITPYYVPAPPVIGAAPAAGPALALPKTASARFLTGDPSLPRATAPAFLLHSALLI